MYTLLTLAKSNRTVASFMTLITIAYGPQRTTIVMDSRRPYYTYELMSLVRSHYTGNDLYLVLDGHVFQPIYGDEQLRWACDLVSRYIASTLTDMELTSYDELQKEMDHTTLFTESLAPCRQRRRFPTVFKKRSPGDPPEIVAQPMNTEDTLPFSPCVHGTVATGTATNVLGKATSGDTNTGARVQQRLSRHFFEDDQSCHEYSRDMGIPTGDSLMGSEAEVPQTKKSCL